jgi:hypothetical protein
VEREAAPTLMSPLPIMVGSTCEINGAILL